MNEAPDLLLQLYGAVVPDVRAALFVAISPVPLAAVVGGALAVPALHVREGHHAPAVSAEEHPAGKLPSATTPPVVAGVRAHLLPRAVHERAGDAVLLVRVELGGHLRGDHHTHLLEGVRSIEVGQHDAPDGVMVPVHPARRGWQCVAHKDLADTEDAATFGKRKEDAPHHAH